MTDNAINGSRLLLWHVAAAALIALAISIATGIPLWSVSGDWQIAAVIFMVAYLASVIWPTVGLIRRGKANLVVAYGLTFGVFLLGYFVAQSLGLEYRKSVAFVPLLVAFLLLPFLCRAKFGGALMSVVLVAAAGWGWGLTESGKSVVFKNAETMREYYVKAAFNNVRVREYLRQVPDHKANGGGLTRLGDRYLLGNGDGRLYIISPEFDADELDIAESAYRVPVNLAEFKQAADEGVDVRRFRVMDVLAEVEGSNARIYATHHWWDQAQACHVIRLSSLAVSVEGLLAGAGPGEWKTLFQSQPCLPITANGKAFFSGQESGGRIIRYDEASLLISFGVQRFNGVDAKPNLPQDISATYGKTWLINTTTGAADLFSVGHRNMQGLHKDASGTVWATEHGPQGGDELNILRSGVNYGWPLVTYGTQYGRLSWPAGKSQGDHVGYEQPVYAWVPSIGVSNLIRVASSRFKAWQGNLLVGSLNTKTLFRVGLTAGRVAFVEPIKLGERLRDLVEMPDGRILIWTDAAKLLVLDSAGADASPAALFAANCSGCHRLEGGDHGIGPNLNGIVGREIGSAAGYDYSVALAGMGGSWTAEALDQFLADPQAFSPGNAMEAPPLEDAATRSRLVEFLRR